MAPPRKIAPKSISNSNWETQVNSENVAAVDVLLDWLTMDDHTRIFAREKTCSSKKSDLVNQAIAYLVQYDINERSVKAVDSKISSLIKSARLARNWLNNIGQGLRGEIDENDNSPAANKKRERIEQSIKGK